MLQTRIRIWNVGVLFLLVMFVGCQAKETTSKTSPSTRSQNSAPAVSKFTAPEDSSELFANWEKVSGIEWSIDSSNALAPRAYRAESGANYGYTTFEGAVEHLAKNAEIEISGPVIMRDLEAWKAWDGRTAKIVIAPTKLGNEAGVLVLYLTRARGSEKFSMLGYEVTENDFLAWGGITRMLKLRGVIPSVDAFPKETRIRIAGSPFKQQTDLYNEVLSKQFVVLSKGMMQTMTQGQALLRMQELNYDLILGGDITSPTIAD